MKKAKKIVSAVSIIAICVLSGGLFAEKEKKADNFNALLMKGMQLETGKADYEGAIKVYKKLLEKCEDDDIAMKTVLRMMNAHSKTGKKECQDAKKIMNNVKNAYTKLSSYQDNGEVYQKATILNEDSKMTVPGNLPVKEVPMPVGDYQFQNEFKIYMKKPNFLKFEWTGMMLPGANVIWCDSKNAYKCFSFRNKPEKAKSLRMAIAAATGVSGGSANNIPSMLLSQSNLFITFKPLFVGKGVCDGTECHIMAGKEVMSDIIIWIDMKTKMIKKLERIMTVNDKWRTKMDKSFKESEKVTGNKIERIELPDMKTVTREIHRNIKLNEDIPDSVFNYKPADNK